MMSFSFLDCEAPRAVRSDPQFSVEYGRIGCFGQHVKHPFIAKLDDLVAYFRRFNLDPASQNSSNWSALDWNWEPWLRNIGSSVAGVRSDKLTNTPIDRKYVFYEGFIRRDVMPDEFPPRMTIFVPPSSDSGEYNTVTVKNKAYKIRRRR